MKKILVLTTFICIFLCACGTNTPFETSHTESSDELPTSPLFDPLEFDSFEELKNAVDPQNEKELYSYFSNQHAGNKQIEAIKNMVKSIQLYDNIVPCVDGSAVELRGEEGFSNITLFAVEKYGLPCVFLHPKVSNGDNLYITITYIPDEILSNRKDATASDIIKTMSPQYPNIDNVGDKCRNVYNTAIKLSDREVTALVYEYKNDDRNSTIFIYDNLIVEVRNDPEIWDLSWFASLSFGGFDKA